MVYKKDGLIFKKSFFLNEEAIYLDTSKIEKCIKYIQDNGIKSIIINSQYGFKLNNLSFLIEVNYIEELIIETEIKKLDVSTINNLINLKSLIITGSIEQDINFENFSQLENINIIFNEHIVGVDSCISLKYITLWKYNGENLLLLLNNINIQKLVLFDSSIKSLHGIESLNKLKYLTLERLKFLESIDAIETCISTITELTIRNCKKISNYQVIKLGVNIQYLYILDSAPLDSV